MQYEGFSSPPRDEERFFGYQARDDRSDDYYTDDDGDGFPRAEQDERPDINNRQTSNPNVQINKFLLGETKYADLSEEAKRRFSACVECVEKPPLTDYNTVAIDGGGAAPSSSRRSSSGPSGTLQTASSVRETPVGRPVLSTRVKCEDDCSSNYILTPPLRVLMKREGRNIAAGIDDPRPSSVAVDLMNRRNAETAERVLENALGISVFSFLDQIANACMGVGNKVPTWVKPKAELFQETDLNEPNTQHWDKCLSFQRNKMNYLTHSDSKVNLQCAIFLIEADGIPNAELSLRRAGALQNSDIRFAQPTTVPKIDLTVSENILRRAKKVALMHRIPETLTKFVDVKILTVIRESELDVWNACGGVENKLPHNTWFSRPFESPGQIERKRKTCARSLDELVNEFKTELTPEEKEIETLLSDYFYEGQTFFQQLKDTDAIEEAKRTSAEFKNAKKVLFDAESLLTVLTRMDADPNGLARRNAAQQVEIAMTGRNAARDAAIAANTQAKNDFIIKYTLDDKFRKWKKKRLDKIPVSVVDVLMMGGYELKRNFEHPHNPVEPGNDDGLWVQEAADLLVARAAQTGMIDNAYPKDAMSYLLFTNDVKGDASPVTVEIADKPVSDGLFEFVQDCFKRGKEKLLKRYCDAGRGCGGECLLVTDPEYRTAFVKLCEVNFQLREMRVGIVNDRRQKIFDLQREKREVLHSFQAKNGTARKIKDRYVDFSMMY